MEKRQSSRSRQAQFSLTHIHLLDTVLAADNSQELHVCQALWLLNCWRWWCIKNESHVLTLWWKGVYMNSNSWDSSTGFLQDFSGQWHLLDHSILMISRLYSSSNSLVYFSLLTFWSSTYLFAFTFCLILDCKWKEKEVEAQWAKVCNDATTDWLVAGIPWMEMFNDPSLKGPQLLPKDLSVDLAAVCPLLVYKTLLRYSQLGKQGRFCPALLIWCGDECYMTAHRLS